MANMSYCRYRNTLSDLRDCWEDLQEKAETGDELSVDEIYARDRLIETCKEIAENADNLIEDWKNNASDAEGRTMPATQKRKNQTIRRRNEKRK